jgi:hypothetical protein
MHRDGGMINRELKTTCLVLSEAQFIAAGFFKRIQTSAQPSTTPLIAPGR